MKEYRILRVVSSIARPFHAVHVSIEDAHALDHVFHSISTLCTYIHNTMLSELEILVCQWISGFCMTGIQEGKQY